MNLRKGDKVKVLLGKDRGKTGTVDRVWAKTNLVLVGGLNVYKRHLKSRGEGSRGESGIVEKSRPFSVGKIALLCSKCGKITRSRTCHCQETK